MGRPYLKILINDEFKNLSMILNITYIFYFEGLICLVFFPSILHVYFFWVRLKYAITSVIIDIYCAVNILITPFANFEIPS